MPQGGKLLVSPFRLFTPNFITLVSGLFGSTLSITCLLDTGYKPNSGDLFTSLKFFVYIYISIPMISIDILWFCMYMIIIYIYTCVCYTPHVFKSETAPKALMIWFNWHVWHILFLVLQIDVSQLESSPKVVWLNTYNTLKSSILPVLLVTHSKEIVTQPYFHLVGGLEHGWIMTFPSHWE